MRTFCLVTFLGAAASVIGSSLESRDNYDPLEGGDITLLNYALTLEYLQRELYSQGLSNHSAEAFKEAGHDAFVVTNLHEILKDEEIHIASLLDLLRDQAVQPALAYAFPSTTPQTFLALAALLEGTTVSAYIGAMSVIANKNYIKGTASVLAVQARHAAYLRALDARTLAPFPTAFDTPLNFRQVYSIATQYIAAFAPGSELPIQAFPALDLEPFVPTPQVAIKARAASSSAAMASASGVVVSRRAGGKAAKRVNNKRATRAFEAVVAAGSRRWKHDKQKRQTIEDAYHVYVEGGCGIVLKNAYRNAARARLISGYEDVYAVFFSGFEIKTVKAVRRGSDLVVELLPRGIAGQVYIVLSTADGTNTKVADENTISGVGVIEVRGA